MNIPHYVRVLYEKWFSDGYPIDSKEAEQLIAKCHDPYLRYRNRERCSQFRTLIDYYSLPIDGNVILDLGPGHMGFFRMCERLGAPAELIAVDRDEAIIELAEMWGYTAVLSDILSTDFVPQIPVESVDFLFSRGAVDPCQIDDPQDWLEQVFSRLKPNAAIWFVPHYDSKHSAEHFQSVHDRVGNVLDKHRVAVNECPRWVGRYDTHCMEIWQRT